MPELPEVEISVRGIRPYLQDKRVSTVIIRQAKLRWPIPTTLAKNLVGQRINKIERRAKYLLFYCETGTLIMHLGMSGSLRILKATSPPEKHDHVDIVVDSGYCLRYRDPRRFGAILWTNAPVLDHPLLSKLGPEPLSRGFSGEYLKLKSLHRRVAVKVFIMNAAIVVGVGNIYASEALFAARIHPSTAAGRISLQRYNRLVDNIKLVLRKSISAGGTSLRDFSQSDGQPGYFKQALQVYGLAGHDCPRCNAPIKSLVLGQRTTYYCGRCQR
ncbi:MAG: bifunctional DNA-formamidopyrimidine glycosylase/DNA-(apurinic or apyrimidinic site) lyase [Thiohalomonadales bacterium]